jgi:hypothetical protein
MTTPPAATLEREKTVWYVYGVVPADEATPELFEGVGGVGGSGVPVRLVRGDGLAAIVSAVPSGEFAEPLQERLADPGWLEEKVRAHAAVLDTVVGRVPLVPLRFGAVYRSEEHVRRMLAEHRELAAALERVRGAVEIGVKAFLDPERFAASRAEETPDDETASAGRAYLVRKQHERQLAEAARAFKAACAGGSHEQLAAAAEGARANPPHPPEVVGTSDEMFLNGAYLVRIDRRGSFLAALADLERAYGPSGVRYERTGPWPPYNFVDDEPS